ncbi:MAG: putative DNA binding domain-containing protein [Anaerolineaceae bacterium]|nr:putative DNA binding domain-containing protein [Anaerolineaceae bacterium]
MTLLLPVNVDDLIHARSVEHIRLDYKSTWDEHIKHAAVASISAFANDLHNLNGGYIILGVEAPDGLPILPPRGLNPAKLEEIQQQLRVACEKIDPVPAMVIVPEIYMSHHILIIFVPGSDNRPHKAPDPRNPQSKERFLFVRLGAETVKATGDVYRQLLEQTARTPFDDRRNPDTDYLALSPLLVKRFLQEINSDLMNRTPPSSDIDLYKALRIVSDYGGQLLPKNVGLMFFNEEPRKFFPGVRFEVVQFDDTTGGDVLNEKIFDGPLNMIVLQVIEYLDNLTNIELRKIPQKAQVERTVAFPYEALEEAIVNAAYHRGYEREYTEPNKIYLYPDRMEIISYPGPVNGITVDHLNRFSVPPVPARNRRIGEFFKELRLAEMRGTGIPKIKRTMTKNGSPDPIFDFDETRSYFRVTLPAHPRYVLVHNLRESSLYWSIGEKARAVEILRKTFKLQSGSGAIAGQLIEYAFDLGYYEEAEKVFQEFHQSEPKFETHIPYLRYYKLLINRDNMSAKRILNMMPESSYAEAPRDIAVAFKRLKIWDKAHVILQNAYSHFDNDPVFLHDYAKVKIQIADQMRRRHSFDRSNVKKLREQAVELLHRSIHLLQNSGDDEELAWCWFDLANTIRWMRKPNSQVEEAFRQAIILLPNEQRFQNSYDHWKNRKNKLN